ncbi:MAG: hypothetical protein AAGE59_16660 [Cyanobacteria bacterium P01_F01_bin.86]
MSNEIRQDTVTTRDDTQLSSPSASVMAAGKPLDISLSAKSLEIIPGEQMARLEVKVINQGDRRASFQVEVLAAGGEATATPQWYDLSPAVSSLKPPGDITYFPIAILDTPIPGFFGWVSLTVRVSSLELKAEERQVLRLHVKLPEGAIPLKLEVLTPVVRTKPCSTVQLPVRIFNLAHVGVGALVRCLGLPEDWAEQGLEQALDLLPQQWTPTTFEVSVPLPSNAIAQSWDLTFQAEVPGSPAASATGRLEILPTGRLAFRPPQPESQFLPRIWPWQKTEQQRFAIYQLTFENASNLETMVTVELECKDAPRNLEWLQVTPPESSRPGTEQIQELQVRARRHWLGRTRTYALDAHTALSDKRLGTTVPKTRSLQLDIAPVVPLWLALLSGAGILWLAWLLSWLNPANPLFGHRAAVNSVQFDGLGQTVVSGANDQTAILWEVKGFFQPLRNQEIGTIAQADKAIRVVRHRPFDNDMLAVGLENGEIQFWDLQWGDRPFSLLAPGQKDDRVLDLRFSRDSQILFSSHGSGAVVQWSLRPNAVEQGGSRLQQIEQFDFAAYSLAAVGPDQNQMAVAGRYNRLELWNWQTNQRLPVTYPSGGQDDYITSLATAEAQPYWLAIADNQGRITLLDMETCLASATPCQTLDEWQANPEGEAVRAIALTREGCYLTSVGDDGKVMLWPLVNGRRHGRLASGQTVAQIDSQLNSVDVVVKANRLWIASGADDSRVRVHRPRFPDTTCR